VVFEGDTAKLAECFDRESQDPSSVSEFSCERQKKKNVLSMNNNYAEIK